MLADIMGKGLVATGSVGGALVLYVVQAMTCCMPEIYATLAAHQHLVAGANR